MWSSVSRFILRNRITLLVILVLITGFMAYKAFQVRIVYEFARLLPESDSTSVTYENFKNKFGVDGNVLVLSIQDDRLFELEHFNDWYRLSEEIKSIPGIEGVVSLSRLKNLQKNDSLGKFELVKVLTGMPKTQSELDSSEALINALPFYDGYIYNKETRATVMAITFGDKELNSQSRLVITDAIKVKADAFSRKNGIVVHYSGLPYIRSTMTRMISSEMILFLILALLVTIFILFLFFRNFYAVLFSLIVVAVAVVWSFGTLALLGYKITVLTGLIPPLMIVISVPNCILLLNKYHVEFARHGIQGLALSRTIERIGVSLFFANVTTAIGFAVFCFTRTRILYEFGLVSSLNIMATYMISTVFIPIVFSFLPPPSVKHTRHLHGKRVSKILEKVDHLVHHHRKKVYVVVAFIVLLSGVGMYLIKSLGYVVDDLPRNHPIYTDMGYFEKNFHGVLPFEIVIDTKKENGVFADNGRILYKINALQKLFARYPSFSKPMSVAEVVKYSYQAYKGGNPKFYRLPGAMELSKLSDYAGDAKARQGLFKALIDSNRQTACISLYMADIGSIKMKKVVNELKPRVDSIFNYDSENRVWLPQEQRCAITTTGFCLMFLKGNDFLVENLLESVVLAIFLIALVMFFLFMTGPMVIIAVIPSLVPLLFTAGLMGFFNIHLKPSTILIFSIAFGISSDGTLYFLTKYRQEMKRRKTSISSVVSLTIRETGISMIYTAIILSCGFGIFMFSQFGGTAALGILVSFTLLVAYCSNLVLLPCFLLSLEKRITSKAFIENSDVELDNELEEIEL